MMIAEREAWIEKWYNAYKRDHWALDAEIAFYKPGNGYISVCRREYTHGKDKTIIGEARCNPNDEFKDEIGIAIAYARSCGEPIPDFI